MSALTIADARLVTFRKLGLVDEDPVATELLHAGELIAQIVNDG